MTTLGSLVTSQNQGNDMEVQGQLTSEQEARPTSHAWVPQMQMAHKVGWAKLAINRQLQNSLLTYWSEAGCRPEREGGTVQMEWYQRMFFVPYLFQRKLSGLFKAPGDPNVQPGLRSRRLQKGSCEPGLSQDHLTCRKKANTVSVEGCGARSQEIGSYSPPPLGPCGPWPWPSPPTGSGPDWHEEGLGPNLG